MMRQGMRRAFLSYWIFLECLEKQQAEDQSSGCYLCNDHGRFLSDLNQYENGSAAVDVESEI